MAKTLAFLTQNKATLCIKFIITWGVTQVRGQDGADHGATVDGHVEPQEERFDLGFLANANFFPRKLSKIAENCRKLSKIAENCRKSPKIVENRQKLSKIAENCDHNIDLRSNIIIM
jgi:hypothetical protein